MINIIISAILVQLLALLLSISGKRKRRVISALDVLIRDQHPVIANKALFNIEYFKEV